MADPAATPSGLPPLAKKETVAGRARQVAERIRHLLETVRKFFQLEDPNHRIEAVQHLGLEVVVDMIPVFSWLERRRPADAIALVKHRLDVVFEAAVELARLDIPWFASGTAAPTDQGTVALQAVANLTISARLFATHLEDWANDIEEEDEKRSGAPIEAPHGTPIIWDHGDRAYSRDRINSFVVTEEENYILLAFCNAAKAMDTATLADKSGVTNVPRVIKRLRERYGGIFADAIRTPEGAKGSGGYFARVQNVKS